MYKTPLKDEKTQKTLKKNGIEQVALTHACMGVRAMHLNGRICSQPVALPIRAWIEWPSKEYFASIFVKSLQGLPVPLRYPFTQPVLYIAPLTIIGWTLFTNLVVPCQTFYPSKNYTSKEYGDESFSNFNSFSSL